MRWVGLLWISLAGFFGVNWVDLHHRPDKPKWDVRPSRLTWLTFKWLIRPQREASGVSSHVSLCFPLFKRHDVTMCVFFGGGNPGNPCWFDDLRIQIFGNLYMKGIDDRCHTSPQVARKNTGILAVQSRRGWAFPTGLSLNEVVGESRPNRQRVFVVEMVKNDEKYKRKPCFLLIL